MAKDKEKQSPPTPPPNTSSTRDGKQEITKPSAPPNTVKTYGEKPGNKGK